MSIVIATEIDIDATPGAVWEVLADFLSYGDWSNFSKVDGEPRLGARLRMRMPGMSFGSTVTAATPGQKLEWAARIVSASIFEGRHTFVLTPNADGTTHLANVETFSGALVWPLQPFFRQGAKPRANGYDGFNQALKRRVERQREAAY
ncbi:SRPBCC domain-containing protein [Mesorhizobium sp. CAU 1741]|uniref:SRPBCC domain-containing protein n=1 Tax=Mesorhizobium sp. CAU 1741 TaxID=3140366 RepID=UPI00325AC1FB